MIRICASLLLAALLWPPAASAQDRADLPVMLGFDGPVDDGVPRGWRSTVPGAFAVDETIVHGGRAAGRLHHDAGSTRAYSAVRLSIPVQFHGRVLELRGFVRTDGVNGPAGLLMQLEAAGSAIAVADMESRPIRGTTDWAQYRIQLTLDPGTLDVVVGAWLYGEGTVWVDDLELLVDGVPVTDVPRLPRAPTVLETDTEFVAGSGVALTELSPEQVEHLAALGEVWGFLKYHHQRVTSGELHWDFELFRVLPAVLGAASAPARNRTLGEWAERIGEPEPCDLCAGLPADLHLGPELDWIGDESRFGQPLAEYLERVYANRSAAASQFYVRMHPDAGNALFDRELLYGELQAPDAGYRLLAVFRYWNVVRYWFPYRDVIGRPWEDVLVEAIPEIVAAEGRAEYEAALARLIARIHDSHARLVGTTGVQPPAGPCHLPVRVRFIGERPVVAREAGEAGGPESNTGLAVGDVLLSLDGVPVETLVEEWLPYYSGSNRTARLAELALAMTRGPCTMASVLVERGDARLEVNVRRLPRDDLRPPPHDRPGEAFQRLSEDVAYLKLSGVEAAEAARYVEEAEGTRGLVIDIRNYPREFVVFALGQHLAREPTPFAAFTVPDAANPGAFRWDFVPAHEPAPPHYEGKVVILVDEATISQAEYTAMAFRVAPDAVVVGSTTRAADGNVSTFALPGGLRTSISGLGVFYPDRRPTQRVGIVPDVYSAPTVEGVREGRDEVLEQALFEILGPDADEEEIRALATPPAP